MYPKKIPILMLSLCLAAHLSLAGQKTDPRLSPLEPLLNKIWVGALKTPDGSAEFKVVRRFEAVWDGKVIKYTKTNRDLNNSGEGYIYWDDISKRPSFFFIESSGVYLKGFVSSENNLITFEGTMTWPQPNRRGGQSFKFRNTFEFISGAEMTDQWFHNAFGPWQPGHVIAFKAEDKQTTHSLPDDSYSKMHIIDGHSHDLVAGGGSEPAQAGMKRLSRAGVDGVILAFPLNRVEPDKLIQQILTDINTVKRQASANNIKLKFTDKFFFPGDGQSDNPLQVLSSVEYFDGLFDADLKNIDQFREIGIASITIIDSNDDRLSEIKSGKKILSDFGQKIIQKLNDVGIVIDITHLSGAMQLEVIKASRKPVFASHSNVRGVIDTARNLSDEVLSELTTRGGMVLLTFDKEYLLGRDSATGAAGIPKLMEHIDHVVRRYGIDHVGIGTDYGGSGSNAPPDLFGVECFRSIANVLIENGCSLEHVKKIMGGNLIDFFSAAEENSI